MKKYGDQNLKTKDTQFIIGEYVLCKQERKKKSDPIFNDIIYEIIDIKGSMITAYSPNHVTTRNSSYFKKTSIKPNWLHNKTSIKPPEHQDTSNHVQKQQFVNTKYIFKPYNEVNDQIVNDQAVNGQLANDKIGNNQIVSNDRIQIEHTNIIIINDYTTGSNILDVQNTVPDTSAQPIIENTALRDNDVNQNVSTNNELIITDNDHVIADGINSEIANQVQTVQLYFGLTVQSNNNLILQNQSVENNNAQDMTDNTVVASTSNQESQNEQVNVPVTQIAETITIQNDETVTETQAVVNSNNLISENIEKRERIVKIAKQINDNDKEVFYELEESFSDEIVSTPTSSSAKSGETILRNSTTSEDSMSDETKSSTETTSTVITRSGRIVKQPKHYDNNSGKFN